MEWVLWCVALGLVAVPAVPVLVFAAECLSGSLPRHSQGAPTHGFRLPVAVLVPAHDEERGITRTLALIRAQMRSGDRLLVVADNCSDRTAELARAAGAEVIERRNADQRGKGYALDYGLQHLRQAPCPVVVFVDADCELVAGSLDALARSIAASGRPVQSLNLMTARDRAGTINGGVAEFAFRVKNLVRPRGLARFGLPCQLMGTGMALPWEVVGEASFANGHLAEDMKLGLELAGAGHAPLFCETACVLSAFPESDVGADGQRSRWENGHLKLMSASLPALFTRQVARSPAAIAMTLDVLVPPLTLLAFVQFAALVAGLAAAWAGLGLAPLVVAGAATALLLAGTAAAWRAEGRDIVPPAALLRIPLYMLAKAWIYPRALFGQVEQAWVRAERNRA